MYKCHAIKIPSKDVVGTHPLEGGGLLWVILGVYHFSKYGRKSS